jgi:hypothetical protein
VKNLTILSIFFLFLFSVYKVEAQSTSNIEIVICDYCTSVSSFENAAKAIRSGDVAVFNLRTGEVRSYDVIFEPNFGGRIPIEVSNSQEVINALNDYKALESVINGLLLPIRSSTVEVKDEYVKSTSFLSTPVMSANSLFNGGPFGGVCGPEANQRIATLIPDGVFTQACAGHDACYASGQSSKSFCDEAFRLDLDRAAQIGGEIYGRSNPITRILAERLLKSAGSLYYYFVVNSESAYDAFCSSGTNASTSFCGVGFAIANAAMRGGDGVDLGTSTGIDVTPGLDLELTFQCVTTIITTSDGKTFVNETCFLAPR